MISIAREFLRAIKVRGVVRRIYQHRASFDGADPFSLWLAIGCLALTFLVSAAAIAGLIVLASSASLR